MVFHSYITTGNVLAVSAAALPRGSEMFQSGATSNNHTSQRDSNEVYRLTVAYHDHTVRVDRYVAYV